LLGNGAERENTARLNRSAFRRPLTPAEFCDLADIPPELEWLTNPKTRRAYKIDVEE
jgi:hypothetical protein